MEVEYTDAFLHQLRRLGRRYRHIRDDVRPVIEQLQAGVILGEQIPHTGLTLFKVRVRNRDIQKGKSAGYRLICQVGRAQDVPDIQRHEPGNVGQRGAFARATNNCASPV